MYRASGAAVLHQPGGHALNTVAIKGLKNADAVTIFQNMMKKINFVRIASSFGDKPVAFGH